MSCQPSSSATRPSTAPWGHQLRRKNSRIAIATATTIPCSTPSRITPALAVSETHEGARADREVATEDRHVGQGERRHDHDRREGGLGQVREQRVEEQQQHDHERRADEARHLALGTRLLGDRRARAAGRDGEALEQAGGDVRCAHPDHLLVGLDLVAAPGGEAGGRGDRVGERHERDADRRDQQRPGCRSRWSTAGSASEPPAGSEPTVVDAVIGQVRAPPRARSRRPPPRAPPAPAARSGAGRAARRRRRARRRASPRSSRRARRRTRAPRSGTSPRGWRSRTASVAARR